ncbi:CCL4 protein, partial [Podargus strigoides]|nr:CCL4 protein [Podargus strigoides]
ITCCVKSMRIRIPRRLITSAYMTSSSCILPAVILVTKNGMKICADPKAPWVEAYLKHFETLKK